MRSWLVNISRLLLGAVFILSGFVKAIDPLGTQYKLNDYLAVLNMGKFIPDWATLGAAVLLAALEFCMGLFLLFGVRKQMTSRVTLLMLVIMTPLTLWLALADPIHDCGCFGDALVLTNWQTFFKNVVLLAMALVVAYQPERMFRLVSESNQWLVTNYSAVFILAVSGYCLYDLPLFDFRPYHIGTDLKTGWQKMMNGEESPYAEFFIQRTEDGEDITDSLLSQKGYLFLLIAPHVENADDSQLDLINQMFEYAEDYEYPFYALTASGEKGIDRWRDITGAEYPFCQTDETTLQTIIRSNPGLVLLKDGVIIRKWSRNSIPDEYELTDRLEKLKIGKMPKESMSEKIFIIALWYILPLLLLTIADRLWAWTKWLKRREQSNKIYQLFKQKTNNEKENRSRQLENEPEPARGSGSGQGTE
jgi:triosephosphate isomerase